MLPFYKKLHNGHKSYTFVNSNFRVLVLILDYKSLG